MSAVTHLEERLNKGERYMERNPSERARVLPLYYRLLAEYVSLVEQQENEADIRAVTLDLPAGTSYQKPGSEAVHTRVRLVYGPPEGDADLTSDDLRALLATRAEVQALLQPER